MRSPSDAVQQSGRRSDCQGGRSIRPRNLWPLEWNVMYWLRGLGWRQRQKHGHCNRRLDGCDSRRSHRGRNTFARQDLRRRKGLHVAIMRMIGRQFCAYCKEQEQHTQRRAPCIAELTKRRKLTEQSHVYRITHPAALHAPAYALREAEQALIHQQSRSSSRTAGIPRVSLYRQTMVSRTVGRTGWRRKSGSSVPAFTYRQEDLESFVSVDAKSPCTARRQTQSAPSGQHRFCGALLCHSSVVRGDAVFVPQF